MNGLSKPITYLKGVGEKRAQLYEKLNIFTVRDLLYHFPRSYVDFTKPAPLDETENGQQVVVEATVVRKLQSARIRRDFVIYKALARDVNSQCGLTLTFFNQPYAFENIKENETYLFYGKVSGDFLKKEMNSPQTISINDKNFILPNYPLTAKLTVKMLRTNVSDALKIADVSDIETLSEEIRHKYDLCDLKTALNSIHFPQKISDAQLAQRRLAFDELLCLSLGLTVLGKKNRSQSGCVMQNTDIGAFYAALPFEMTQGQFLAVCDIIGDMQKNVPMNRLLQGDVGSGKTVVAAAACYFSYKNGFQSALMAPTEILAKQHYNTLKNFLEMHNIKVCLLIGSQSEKQKKQLKEQIAGGEFDVIVGTQALIQGTTEFHRLGLVITDEQHRFGVRQRSLFAKKGEHPHCLFMSATPIPRTLSLIIYGDLDISLIEELPKGRSEIETFAVTGKLRKRAYEFIKKELDEKRRAYIVCPAIDENESDLESVVKYAKDISENDFSDYKVGLLHGKMSSDEKQSTMEKFKSGEIDLLVCTTVVEVGVDVPSATVIMIENAERYGLSQLHQLRGRVGRGKFKSYCILITDSKSQTAIERVKILSRLKNGFEISEQDLRLRGPGDFFGTRQHGLPELKIASLNDDAALIEQAQQCAREILSSDSFKETSEYKALQNAVNRLFDSKHGG